MANPIPISRSTGMVVPRTKGILPFRSAITVPPFSRVTSMAAATASTVVPRL